jgi:hypothetical protein
MDRSILIADRPDETAFLAQRREDEGAPHAQHYARQIRPRRAEPRQLDGFVAAAHRSEREGAQADPDGASPSPPMMDVEHQAASRSSEAAG